MAVHKIKARELQVEEITTLDADVIMINKIARYGTADPIENDFDLVPKNYVDNSLGDYVPIIGIIPDANLVKSTSVGFIGSLGANNPVPGQGCTIKTASYDGQYGNQVGITNDVPARMFLRTFNPSSWFAWVELSQAFDPIPGTSDASGEFDLSSYDIPEYPNVTIYDKDGLQSTAQYDNANKKIVFLNASENFTFKYSV